MKLCLLTAHPEVHATRRIKEECELLKLPLQVINPLQYSFTSQSEEKFDVTLNRFSAVDDRDGFIRTLMLAKFWGKQVNSSDIRLQFWDKSRQKIWLMQNGFSTLPFWSHRGELDLKRWEHFALSRPQDGWVLKVNRGQKGIGVHFIDTESELMSWFETLRRMGDQDFLVEPRLRIEREFRLTTLHHKPWALLERSGEKGNFHQGGLARELKMGEAPQPLVDLIERFCEIPAHYLSVDILQSQNTLYISDLNTSPGFEQLEATTGRNFAANLLEVIRLKA